MMQGPPPQTSTTAPFGFRNSDFWTRAGAKPRGSPCGSRPVPGARFVGGGAGVPLSQIAKLGYGMANVPATGGHGH